MDDTKNMLVEAILELTKEIKELRQELKTKPKAREEVDFPPNEPDIRPVFGKANKEPKTGTEEIIAWATQQVNNHLSGLAGDDLKDIIQSALTGKPIKEKEGYVHHTDGTKGKMTEWLNANIPVVNTQENVWNAIDKAQDTARERIGILHKEAREDWERIAKGNPDLVKALARADVDTAKSKTEIDQASSIGYEEAK